MAAAVLLLLFYALAFYAGVNAKIHSMDVSTVGFVQSEKDDIKPNGVSLLSSALMFKRSCYRVLRIKTPNPEREVDELVVTCTGNTWAASEGMIHYGKDFYMKVTSDKVLWAVYVLDENCIQRTYTDKGEVKLAKDDKTLTFDECNEVVKTLKGAGHMKEKIFAQGVIAMNDFGHPAAQSSGVVSMSHKASGLLFQTEDFYDDKTECVRMATISIYGYNVERLLITCDVHDGREVQGHFQYGYAFSFRPLMNSYTFKGVYNLRDGTCSQRIYSLLNRRPLSFAMSIEKIIVNDECKDLAGGRDVLNYERVFGAQKKSRGLSRLFDPDWLRGRISISRWNKGV